MANPLPVIIHQDEVGMKEAIVDLKGSLQGLTFQIATNTKDARDHLGKIATRMMQIVDAVKADEPGTDLVPVDGDVGTGTDVVPVDQADEEQDATKLLEEIATNTRATAFATAKVYEAITMANREASEDVLDPNDAQPVDPNETPLLESPDADTNTKAKKGILDFLAILFGTLAGAIGGIVGGFAKAFNIVILKPLKAIGGAFSNMFKGLVKKVLPKKFIEGFKKVVGGIKSAFTTVIGFFKDIGSKLKGVASTVKSAVMTPFVKIGEFFSKFKGGGLGGIIDKVANLFKPFTNFFQGLRTFFTKFKAVAFAVGRAVGKIFLPLTIIMASIDTIIGAVKGFANTEGSMIDKIIGGIMGAIGGLFDFFISFPINLVKNLIAWIAGALGFEGIKEKLDSFEYSFDFLIDSIFGFVQGIGNFFSDLMQDVGIPPFKFKAFEGTWAEVGFEFGGYYPFRGAKAPTVETDGGGDSGGGEAMDAGGDATKMMPETEDVDDNFYSITVDGKKYMVSGTPDADGMYTAINEDGKLVGLKDGTGTVATLVEAAKLDASAADGGSTSGGDIDGATQDANVAAEQAAMGPGGDTAISAPMTNIGGATTSVSTTNISSTTADNSLKTRQQKYSW